MNAFVAVNELRHRRNPIETAREYKRTRGMALKTDLIDWIGGYPYEHASVDEIITFCERECGMTERRTIGLTPKDTGCNQFVFDRTG